MTFFGKHRPLVAFAVWLLVAMLALSSCIMDDGSGDVAPDTDAGVQVGLHISLGTPAGAAKVPAGNYDDATATAYENFIDIENGGYRVLFFDMDNRYLATFEPQKFTALGSDRLTSKTYEVTGKVDADMPSNFKVVVLANWPSYPQNLVRGVTTVADICSADNARFSYHSIYQLSPSELIPMYGIKECKNVTLRDKIIVPLGTVHLLRAMAKVEVLGTEGPWTIEEVKLHNYNGFGYCAPADVFNEADYVRYDYALDFNTNIHIPTGAFMQSALSLGEVASGHFVIYVPEYQNTLNGIGIGNKATLGIRFKERTDKEYAVDFKYYQSPSADVTEGTPFDIRRNYDYRFVIHKVGEEAELQLSVDVLPYTQYDLYPEFGQ
ncbi:MAG: hypothetical protein ACI36Z_10445 [Alloprevotella sp.]